MQTITELLSLSNDATADQIIEAARVLHGRATTLEHQLSTQHSELSTLSNTLRTQDTELRTAQSQFAAERSARIELLLANAIEKGRITLAQRDRWRGELEKDFAAAEAALSHQAAALNTTSVTRELGNEKAAYDTEATRRSALVAYLAKNKPAACPTTTPGLRPRSNGPRSSPT